MISNVGRQPIRATLWVNELSPPPCPQNQGLAIERLLGKYVLVGIYLHMAAPRAPFFVNDGYPQPEPSDMEISKS